MSVYKKIAFEKLKSESSTVKISLMATVLFPVTLLAASYTVSNTAADLGTISFPATISGTLYNNYSTTDGYIETITFKPKVSGTCLVSTFPKLDFGATHTIKSSVMCNTLTELANWTGSGSANIAFSSANYYTIKLQMIAPSYYTTTQYSYTATIGGSSSQESGQQTLMTTNDIPVVEPTGAFSAPSAKKLQGAVFKDGKVFGSIQLKVGRASSKTGESKVSATVYGLDGKKYAAKAVKVPTGATPEATLSVKNLGTLKVTIGENGFAGTLDGMTVTSVEATPATSTVKADFLADNLSSVVPDALTNYFPKAEAVTRTERKWKVVDKPGKLKLVKEDDDYDFRETGDNIAGLKLTYAWKTQTFKGSFKIWTFNEARLKLKSVKAKVTGVVVNGSGYGQVTVKKVKVGEMTVR